ncbi:MAG TPA: rhodanese-like domain-containing protein [Candidatus Scatomonas merdavium]|nr:rhodanese-like domain-containing protein [Candidatus Scatomonas merdavium]
MNGLEPISADMIDFYAGRPDVAIIDLRTEQEYAAGHIRGARNIPYEEAEGRIHLPRQKILLLYCERGSSSLALGRRLAEKGYQVKSVIGGIHAYRGRNFVPA